MNKNWELAVILAVMLLAAAMPAATAAWQEKPMEKPAEKAAAPKPGAAEMQRLKFYLGEWNYTEDYSKGGRNSGVYTSKLGPGGNSLVNSFHSKGPVGDFEGLLVITWDLQENTYKQYLFVNDLPGCVVETGKFEGDVLVFRGELLVQGIRVGIRSATRSVSPERIESEAYSSIAGAPETLVVKVTATKK
jgi:hypothetical protein